MSKLSRKSAILLAILVALSLACPIAAFGSSSRFPVTVVDDFGRRVTIDSEPQRIVCQGPSCTEIVYALGALDKIVAVDPYSDYPPEVVGRPKIGASGLGYIKLHASAEDFINLRPDLIITFSYVEEERVSDTILPQLEALGLKVIVLKPSSIEDVLSDIELVGEAIGRRSEALALINNLKARIKAVEEKVKGVTYKPKVYMETWYPPPWTFGPGTWGHQLIEKAGGVNVFGDAKTQWLQASDEEVIARDPDIIISLRGAMHNATLEDFKARPGWSQIKAVQRGEVYVVDENLFVRPGPRLVDGLEILAGILHPEIFGRVKIASVDVNVNAVRGGLAQTLSSAAEVFNFTLLLMETNAANNFALKATVTRVGPSPPQGLKMIGDYLNVHTSISGIALKLLVIINYRGAEVKKLGVDERTLAVYTWDGEKWIRAASAVMVDEDLVVAMVNHTSYLALMGKPSPPPPPLMSTPIPLWQALTMSIVAAAVLCLVGFTAGLRRRR
ncbi:MAG: hypothetical protein DRJ97_01070 [Thermoprotei archaeon]|nr:MAG: hypothetical protein DRJ97_01070 [Thermoprotei archaeon]